MPNKYDKYFKILELDIQASKEDVKKAFSELSHIWHPDNYMGKPSNIQDRATRKFKKISTAYQILNEYLGGEDSDSDAEEKKKAEQERREREEKERKQREENERLKKEEEIRRKTEQERREREEKERKQRDENERLKKEEEIRRKTEQERREREEKEKEKANKKHQEEKSKKKNTAQDSEFSWWRDFLSWALILPLLVMGLIVVVPWIDEWTADIGDKASHKVVGNTNPKTNGNKNSQPESLSWKRSFRGKIIDRQGLTLNLERNGDNFIGYYIDVHEMKKKILIGKFDNKFPRNLVLDEYIDGKKSGSFYGNFIAGKGIDGEYISQSEPNNKLKFKLKEINTPTTESRKTKNESRKVTNSHFFEQGLKAYKNKYYKKALEILQPLAEQGNDAAQYILGLIYQNGQGVLQDYKEAVYWFRLSAAQEHRNAQYQLGKMYQDGQGVDQDYALAHMWFKLCGSNGDEGCLKNQDIVTMKMTPTQIEKAQEFARKWKSTKKDETDELKKMLEYSPPLEITEEEVKQPPKAAPLESNVISKLENKELPLTDGELKKMLEYSPPLEIIEEEAKQSPKAAPLESDLDLPIANPIPDESWRPAHELPLTGPSDEMEEEYEVPLTGPSDEMEEEAENLFKDSDSWTEQ